MSRRRWDKVKLPKLLNNFFAINISEEKVLVFCPKCGKKLQYRKVLVLSNHNAITCQVCSSRLRVKNRNISSAIGGVGGGLGAFLGFLLFRSWFLTGNIVFLGLNVILFVMLLVISIILTDKYVRVGLEAGSKNVFPIKNNM